MDTEEKYQADLSAFPCEEYLHADYSRGLFHPAAAMKLLPNGESKISRSGSYLTIGFIYDDQDLIICYRKSEPGIWGLHKPTGKYHLLKQNLKEFVEGWYPVVEKFYWSLMESKLQWQEIIQFYTLHEEKYQWKVKPFMDFIQECVAMQLPERFFIKADRNQFSISSENGFHSRARKNMVSVYMDYDTEDYAINYNLNFFNEHSRKTFSASEIRQAIESIVEWVGIESEY